LNICNKRRREAHNIDTVVLFLLCHFLLVFFLKKSEKKIFEMEQGDKFKNEPPWHLVDIFWDFEGQHVFESLSIDVIVEDVIPEGTLLYISPISIDLSKQPLYCGFQTKTGGYESPAKNAPWKDLYVHLFDVLFARL
jgi:hypothetical protein